MPCYFSLLLVWLLLAAHLVAAKDSPPIEPDSAAMNYILERVTARPTVPWAMVQLADNSILISERRGTLWHWRDGKVTEITGLPNVYSYGQGGLLDLTLHPNIANLLYFTYSYETTKGANTALARGYIRANRLENIEVLYRGQPVVSTAQHFGSRIVVAPPYVYFTTGDRAQRATLPQDLSSDSGKVLRLHVDGTIPKDNPYPLAGSPTAVYSYGHRNPQGLAQHPKTQAIWSHEHGPRGGDEINIIQAGANYAWPLASFGINYSGTRFTDLTHLEGSVAPLWYWTPSIAPSDMVFVTSPYYPELQGKLLVGALVARQLVVLTVNDEQVLNHKAWLQGFGRVRSVMQGRDGFIYIGFDSKGVYRLIRRPLGS